jgi:hypothetical protein
MIYKFEDASENPLSIEFTKGNIGYENDNLIITTYRTDCQSQLSITLCENDIYHLIGALHLIHKEMKS